MFPVRVIIKMDTYGNHAQHAMGLAADIVRRQGFTAIEDVTIGNDSLVPQLLRDQNAKLRAQLLELAECAGWLLKVLDSAGGPPKLMRGVELGNMSWMVKCSDAMEAVRDALPKEM